MKQKEQKHMSMEAKKTAVYASYGIVYRGKKILAPNGVWIPELLLFGTNTKVGDAWTWSIFHGCETWTAADFRQKTAAVMAEFNVDSITGSCPCHCAGCYCDSGCYCFDSTKAANVRRLLIARLYLDFMTRAIIAQIKANDAQQVRIHAAGDFFSVEYVDAWREIALACSDVVFWTYTKNADAVRAFDDVPNISVVPSITPCGVNFGTCSELLEMYHKLTAAGYRVHICACGTDMEKHCAECNHGCKAIGKECEFVLFIKHSTRDYKAGEADPAEFKAVCDIIAAQQN